MDYILVIILGLVIGSFLNVCIYRIPREESISYPPSHCGNCGHNLHPVDLIPIISYVFLKGKCRYCKEKISIRYPMIEGLNCILYLVIYMKYGFMIYTVEFCILISLLIVISMIDYNTQEVYTSTTVFGAIVGVIFILINKFVYGQEVMNLLMGGVTGAAIIGAIVYLTKGMGEGDIEIAGVCGLFIGVKQIILALFLAIMLGGAVGVVVILLNLKNIKDKIAFGPFIAIGTLIAILYGNALISWYFNLLV
ncbi:prepilin peptidase [Clostridium butyricum]|uniref:Prepilin peptidase n=1 Tax=Clostridium butyricum TaxID=1492 RepID=A0A512TKV5_CLOBU|nr:A24 family peptidase [Clostridium butyricum]NOW24602.1 leader peptidase (prepilin peptidase)/N-methyltransferase [Clostridium butyricum]GEQ20856.1 prepilin peptidase [Clostridium butyricum]